MGNVSRDATSGKGGSQPTVERNVPALAVHRGSSVLLFDCGEGTQRPFQRSGLSYMDMDAIVLSHHQGDHVFGLPGHLRTMNLMARSRPLSVVCDQSVQRVLGGMMRMSSSRP